MTEAEQFVLRVLRDPELKDHLAVGGNQGVATYACLTVDECQAAVDSLIEDGLVAIRPGKKGKSIMYFSVDETTEVA